MSEIVWSAGIALAFVIGRYLGRYPLKPAYRVRARARIDKDGKISVRIGKYRSDGTWDTVWTLSLEERRYDGISTRAVIWNWFPTAVIEETEK